ISSLNNFLANIKKRIEDIAKNNGMEKLADNQVNSLAIGIILYNFKIFKKPGKVFNKIKEMYPR
ncbi:MAG: hypothetical protein QW648_01960, partial [Nanoarchaeales archaeon]